MRVEDTILDHDGLRLAAARLGCSYGDALYCLLRVWRSLYKRGGALMRAEEIDAISGCRGFAEALIAPGVELAEDTGSGIRMSGSERAERYGHFLAAQKANSEVAKAMRDEKRSGSPVGTMNVVESTNKVPLGLPTEVPMGVPLTVPVLYLSSLRSDPDPDSGSVTPIRPDPYAAARVQAASWVEWFNRRFGRRLTANRELVKQVKALMALGYSEKPDMRGVALYLKYKWQDDDRMREHLIPSTILRPTRFAERLDLAREWDPAIWAGDQEAG